MREKKFQTDSTIKKKIEEIKFQNVSQFYSYIDSEAPSKEEMILGLNWLFQLNIQYWLKELDILFCSITPTNLGQFSKPGIDLKSASLTFSKHPLHIQFHQVLDEILKVKDTWYQSFIFMINDLLEMKITEIWTICSKNGSVYHQRYQYQQE